MNGRIASRPADGYEWQVAKASWRDWRKLAEIKLPADHPHYRQTEAAQPTPQADTKPDLTARMIKVIREYASGRPDRAIERADGIYRTTFAEAEAIVALLPEPVDPDLIEAREIAAETVPSWTDAQRTKCRSGEYDGNLFVVHSFAGIKRGRALALAGEKEA